MAESISELHTLELVEFHRQVSLFDNDDLLPEDLSNSLVERIVFPELLAQDDVLTASAKLVRGFIGRELASRLRETRHKQATKARAKDYAAR